MVQPGSFDKRDGTRIFMILMIYMDPQILKNQHGQRHQRSILDRGIDREAVFVHLGF